MKRVYLTPTDLRNFEYCNIYWAISKKIDGYTHTDVSKLKIDKKAQKVEKRYMKKGNKWHCMHDLKRIFVTIIFIAVCLGALWLILNLLK